MWLYLHQSLCFLPQSQKILCLSPNSCLTSSHVSLITLAPSRMCYILCLPGKLWLVPWNPPHIGLVISSFVLPLSGHRLSIFALVIMYCNFCLHSLFNRFWTHQGERLSFINLFFPRGECSVKVWTWYLWSWIAPGPDFYSTFNIKSSKTPSPHHHSTLTLESENCKLKSLLTLCCFFCCFFWSWIFSLLFSLTVK